MSPLPTHGYHSRVPSITTHPTRGIFSAVVIRNTTLCREHFRLTLRIRDFPDAAPGQFVQILCASLSKERPVAPQIRNWTPGMRLSPDRSEFQGHRALLRRPFSIGGLRRFGADCEIDVIGRTIGPGTRMLAAMRPDDRTEVLGPLGQPFKIDELAGLAVLVAGGVGLPPILWLSEALNARGFEQIAICGARTVDLLPLKLTAAPHSDGRESMCCSEFGRVNTPIVVTSDDGSIGMRGTTADALTIVLARHGGATERIIVYTCGPEPMMRSVATICSRRNVRCFVALERMMGCGMGTCQSCVVSINNASGAGWHYELCCTHGPVFDASRVAWNTAH